MIPQRVRGLALMHGLFQTFALELLFGVWVALAFFVIRDHNFVLEHYGTYAAVLGVSSLFDLGRSRFVRRNLLHLDMVRNHSVSIRQTAGIVGGLLIFLVASKDVTVSRVFLFSFAPAAYLLFLLTNAVFPVWLAKRLFSGRSNAKTLLLGSVEGATKLRPWLERKIIYGFEPVGLVKSQPGRDDRCYLPVLGGVEDIGDIIQQTDASQLIILDSALPPDQIVELNDLCDKHGLRLLLVNDLEDKFHRTVSYFSDDGFQFVGFRQEPLECPVSRVIKRTLDLMVSIPVVVFILPPISLFVWVLQRRQSPGPLFFRQRRTGKYNKPFLIYKYRTMIVGDFDEGKQAVQADDRIYPAGRVLRKLSLDELPQFINVLIGEMSVVGPRPHFVAHDTLFGEIAHFYRVRSFIKPGITGLAQVRGLRGEARQDRDLIDRIHSDVFYLENWSPILDWVIIFKTAWQIFAPPRSAY